MASICLLAALSFALSRRFSGSKMRTRSDLGLVGRYAFRSIRRRMFCQQSQNPKSTDYQALPEHPDREAHQQQCKICKWTAWGRSTIPRSRKTPGCVESATRKKWAGTGGNTPNETCTGLSDLAGLRDIAINSRFLIAKEIGRMRLPHGCRLESAAENDRIQDTLQTVQMPIGA